jgi:hypothetical protein
MSSLNRPAQTACEIIPMPDISTITARDTWTSVNARTFTHPGIPGWEITVRGPRTFHLAGLLDGMTAPIQNYPTWDAAIAAIAYMHGA